MSPERPRAAGPSQESLSPAPGVLPSMKHIDVVRDEELCGFDSTNGIRRQKAFDRKGIVVARTQVPRSAASGWHHHGKRHLYAYLVAGQLRLEYGPGGTMVAETRRGDFFHIPPRLVHRDVNPSPDEDVVVVNVLVGEGENVFNVPAPVRRR